MNKNTSNSQLKVDGKMTSKGADRVGMLQGISLLIVATSGLLISIAVVLHVMK